MKRPLRQRIWFYKPELHWYGWSTLNPIMTGGDEYDWHTIVLGWTITGRIVIATRHCPGTGKCQEDAEEYGGLTDWPVEKWTYDESQGFGLQGKPFKEGGLAMTEVDLIMQPYDNPATCTDKYENDPVQCDKNTATYWALHMRVHPDQYEAVMQRMALCTQWSEEKPTGEYLWGDSWVEWGDTPRSENDMHLTVYFDSDPSPEFIGKGWTRQDWAWYVGQHLHNHAVYAVEQAGLGDLPLDFAVSTAGDFAEQVNPVRK